MPLALALASGSHAGHAAASGFALIEQSVSGLGNAYAGGASAADDASVQFYNPAALTEIKGAQASAAGHLVMPSSKISNARARVVTLGAAYTGTTDDAGVNGLVPNFYYTRDLSHRLKFGFAVNVPFGLSTDYDVTWIGRYHALESAVETINLNPALAFRLNHQWSFGAGVSAQYISAKLTSAIDSGSVCYGIAGAGAGTACDPSGLTPGNQAVDSYAEVEGDDWGYGFNLGLLFKPTDSMRVGAAYRSSVKQRLEGDAIFTRSAQFNAILGASTQFTNTAVTAGIDLPASLSVSVSQALSPQWEIMGDISWTQWSKFQELRIDYANPVQADSVTTENWNDTLRYAVGLSYKLNDRVKLRTGLAFDESPVPDAEHRTPRIPDSDRTWLALGMTYASSERLSMDVGYAHIFVKDAAMNNSTEAAIAHNLQGNYESRVDILSAQLNYKF